MLLSGAPQGETRQECQPENRFLETSTELDVNEKIFNQVNLLLPHAPVDSAPLLISKSPTVMKTNPCLYMSCVKCYYDFRHLFFSTSRKKMKVSTPQGHFTNSSSGYQCVYILFSILALITNCVLAFVRHHSGVCASELCLWLILAN